MIIDPTIPADSALASTLPAVLRETRLALKQVFDDALANLNGEQAAATIILQGRMNAVEARLGALEFQGAETLLFADAGVGDIIFPILSANDPLAKTIVIVKEDVSYNLVSITPATGTIIDLASVDLSMPKQAIRISPRVATNNWYQV